MLHLARRRAVLTRHLECSMFVLLLLSCSHRLRSLHTNRPESMPLVRKEQEGIHLVIDEGVYLSFIFIHETLHLIRSGFRASLHHIMVPCARQNALRGMYGRAGGALKWQFSRNRPFNRSFY